MELLADVNRRDGVAVLAVLHDLALAAHFFRDSRSSTGQDRRGRAAGPRAGAGADPCDLRRGPRDLRRVRCLCRARWPRRAGRGPRGAVRVDRGTRRPLGSGRGHDTPSPRPRDRLVATLGIAVLVAACGATSTASPSPGGSPVAPAALGVRSRASGATRRRRHRASGRRVILARGQRHAVRVGRPVTRPGTADACSGSAENRDFYSALATSVAWDVYCATLPTDGSSRAAPTGCRTAASSRSRTRVPAGAARRPRRRLLRRASRLRPDGDGCRRRQVRRPGRAAARHREWLVARGRPAGWGRRRLAGKRHRQWTGPPLRPSPPRSPASTSRQWARRSAASSGSRCAALASRVEAAAGLT